MKYVYFDASYRDGRAHLGVIITEQKIRRNKVQGKAVRYARGTTASGSFEAELKAFQFASRIAQTLGIVEPVFFSDNQGLVSLVVRMKESLRKIRRNPLLMALSPMIFPFFPREGFNMHWIPRSLNIQADAITHP